MKLTPTYSQINMQLREVGLLNHLYQQEPLKNKCFFDMSDKLVQGLNDQLFFSICPNIHWELYKSCYAYET